MYQYFGEIKRNHLGLVFIVSLVIANLLPQKHFFDYSSYLSIYENSSGFLPTWEPFFIFLNRLCGSLGLSYTSFRLITQIFGVYSLYQVISTLRLSSHSKLTPKAFNKSNYLLAITLPLFIYEFFLIRIRVGLAIGLCCFGLIHLIKYSSRYSIVNLLLFFLFLILAFFTHKLGTISLFFLCFVPLLLCILKYRIGGFLDYTKAIIFFLGFLILYVITNHEVLRGYNLPSPLNTVRYIAIGLFPLFIFLYQKIMMRNATNSLLDLYAENFLFTYSCLGFALSLFFLFDSINNTGEAIVRVFTLSSFVAIIIIGSIQIIRNQILAPYLVFVNQIFFMWTVGFFGFIS